MSKAHPGQSSSFKIKLEIRARRTKYREAIKKAKEQAKEKNHILDYNELK
jgi:hypothetical protein